MLVNVLAPCEERSSWPNLVSRKAHIRRRGALSGERVVLADPSNTMYVIRGKTEGVSGGSTSRLRTRKSAKKRVNILQRGKEPVDSA